MIVFTPFTNPNRMNRGVEAYNRRNDLSMYTPECVDMTVLSDGDNNASNRNTTTSRTPSLKKLKTTKKTTRRGGKRQDPQDDSEEGDAGEGTRKPARRGRKRKDAPDDSEEGDDTGEEQDVGARSEEPEE